VVDGPVELVKELNGITAGMNERLNSAKATHTAWNLKGIPGDQARCTCAGDVCEKEIPKWRVIRKV
jgi:hypothetical protein